MSDDRLVAGSFSADQDHEEYTLRPKLLKEFVGQQQLKDNLSVFIQAALKRGESLDHVFFSGPPMSWVFNFVRLRHRLWIVPETWPPF